MTITLIIHGPQACGKTALARHFAKSFGSHLEFRQDLFLNPFAMGKALELNPTTILVDDVTFSVGAAPETLHFLSKETILLQRRGFGNDLVSAPNFILCSSDERWSNFNPPDGDRRFCVVAMKPRQSPERSAP